MLGVTKNESEIGEEQRNNRLKGQANTGEKASRCGFVREEREDERKHSNKGECGGSNIKERTLQSRSALSSVGDWTWIGNYSLSLSVPTSLLWLPDAFKPCSYPFHHTQPHTPPLLPRSIHPSQEVQQLEWQAGAGGGIRGAPSREANRCSPSGVAQMADIKTSWGSRER